MMTTRLTTVLLSLALIASACWPVSATEHRNEESPDMGDAWHGLGLNIDGREEIDPETGDSFYIFYDAPEVWFIDESGPAFRAGIRRHDQLTHIDGMPFESMEGGRRFSALVPGDRVEITFRRDGVEQRTAWVVETRPRMSEDESSAELRYAGEHWGTAVEVRGPHDVIVTINREHEEVIIVGGGLFIRLRAAGDDS
jgi:hypothetical protein